MRVANSAFHIAVRLDIEPLAIEHQRDGDAKTASATSSSVDVPRETNALVREAIEAGAKAAFEQVGAPLSVCDAPSRNGRSTRKGMMAGFPLSLCRVVVTQLDVGVGDGAPTSALVASPPALRKSRHDTPTLSDRRALRAGGSAAASGALGAVANCVTAAVLSGASRSNLRLLGPLFAAQLSPLTRARAPQSRSCRSKSS